VAAPRWRSRIRRRLRPGKLPGSWRARTAARPIARTICGIHPGIFAVDLSAAGGYTTELLARTIGPSGTVYGQSRPRDPDKPPTAPAASEGNSHPNVVPAVAPAGGPRPSPVALADREGKLRAAAIPAAPIVAVVRPFEDPIPPELAAEHVDLVTLMFNYRNSQAPP